MWKHYLYILIDIKKKIGKNSHTAVQWRLDLLTTQQPIS